MASASKLNSGAWRCRPTAVINGKKVTKSFTVHPRDCGGDSKKAKAKAELMAREWQISLEQERVYSLTVEQAMDQYINDRSEVLSPASLQTYISYKPYFESIKDMYAQDITTPILQRIINDLAVDLAAKTIKVRVSWMLSVLDYAGNDRKFKLRYPAEAKKVIHTPDHDEVVELISQADEIIKPCICLGALCGLRRAEIAALKQKDILRDMKKIYVHSTIVRAPDNTFVYKDKAKTPKSTRTVDVSAAILELLPQSDDPEALVLNISPTRITRRFERLRDRLGLTCTFHDLRHYAASFRADLGIDEKYIRDELGWTEDSAIFSQVYNNPLKAQSKKYIELTNNFIDDVFGNVLKRSN